MNSLPLIPDVSYSVGSLHFYSGRSLQMCVEEEKMNNENCWSLRNGRIEGHKCGGGVDKGSKAICEHPVMKADKGLLEKMKAMYEDS